MALTLDYAPGYAAVINAFQDKQTARQARLVAYDAAPTEVGAFGLGGADTEVFHFQIGDETTDITTGTAKLTIRFPFAVHIVGFSATVADPSSSGVVTIDVNEGTSPVSLISTKITIDATEYSSATAAAPYVLADADVAAGAPITVDVDAAGTDAKGLKLWVFANRVS